MKSPIGIQDFNRIIEDNFVYVDKRKLFKALARAIKMAVRRDIYHFEVPSSKGSL